MRQLTKLLVLILAVYGPLTPTVMVFLLVAPPLILRSGWPSWVQALLLPYDVGSLLLAAILLGPGAIEEIRAALNDGGEPR
jgi:hypothetical protein